MAESTTSTTSTYRIEPLRGSENYAVWKIKMIDILTDLGLIGYIEAASPASIDAMKARRALSIIRLRVEDGPLVYIASATTAKGAWDALKRMYEPAGSTGIVTARRKLFRAHCPDGADIENHIRTLRGYQTELANLGQALNPSDFSMTLLTSLPDSWNTFISSIDPASMSDTADPDSSKLISRILEEDLRIRSKNSAPEIALPASGHHSRSHASQRQHRSRCFRCGKKGHMIRDCREPESDSDSDNNHGDSSHLAYDFAF